MHLQRIGLVLTVILSSASCRTQMPAASAENPYVGEYSPFAYAPSFVRITEEGGLVLEQLNQGTNPWAPPAANPTKPVRHSETQFSYGNVRVEFGQREDGRFQSLTMSPIGPGVEKAVPRERQRRLLRVDKIIDEYLRPERQEVYAERMLNEMAAGQYTYSRFVSPSRGPVDFAVYLPPGWRADAAETYPLLFFLHGQDGSEHGLPFVVPAAQLNSWIKDERVPPFHARAWRKADAPPE